MDKDKNLEERKRERQRSKPIDDIARDEVFEAPKIEFDQKTKRLIFIIAGSVFAVVLLVLALILFRPKENIMDKTGLQFDGEIYATSNSIYYVNGNEFFCSDLDGDVLWSTAIEPTMQVTGSDSFICTFNEKHAIVYGPNNELRFTLEANDFEIKDAVCGNDIVTFYTETSEGKLFLSSYDINKNNVHRVEIDDVELVQFALTGDNDDLWLLTTDTTGASPVSRVIVYNPMQNKMTGIIEISEQLIYHMWFGKNSNYLMGTSNMISYSKDNEKQSENLTYGLTLADNHEDAEGNLFAFIKNDLTGQKNIYNVHLIKTYENAKPSEILVQLASGVRNVALSKDRLICFAGNTIYYYNINGELAEKKNLDFTVNDVRKLNDNLLIVLTDDGVYLYSI